MENLKNRAFRTKDDIYGYFRLKIASKQIKQSDFSPNIPLYSTFDCGTETFTDKGFDIVFHNYPSYNTATILSIYQSVGLSIMRVRANSDKPNSGGYYEDNI